MYKNPIHPINQSIKAWDFVCIDHFWFIVSLVSATNGNEWKPIRSPWKISTPPRKALKTSTPWTLVQIHRQLLHYWATRDSHHPPRDLPFPRLESSAVAARPTKTSSWKANRVTVERAVVSTFSPVRPFRRPLWMRNCGATFFNRATASVRHNSPAAEARPVPVPPLRTRRPVRSGVSTWRIMRVDIRPWWRCPRKKRKVWRGIAGAALLHTKKRLVLLLFSQTKSYFIDFFSVLFRLDFRSEKWWPLDLELME